MIRAFKTRYFARWMRKRSRLSDETLNEAFNEIRDGLFDADLGGGVIKKRVGLPGRGKRGGARTILITNFRDRWFFVVGFAKNEKDDIADDELMTLRSYAEDLLARQSDELDRLKETGALEEIEL
jgi:hypothetical protein